eukprot:COSAG06_NODE_49399_length_325_cov_1.738938_2_plen_72_part_01
MSVVRFRCLALHHWSGVQHTILVRTLLVRVNDVGRTGASVLARLNRVVAVHRVPEAPSHRNCCLSTPGDYWL